MTWNIDALLSSISYIDPNSLVVERDWGSGALWRWHKPSEADDRLGLGFSSRAAAQNWVENLSFYCWVAGSGSKSVTDGSVKYAVG